MLDPSGAIAACVATIRAPGASAGGRLLRHSSTCWRLTGSGATLLPRGNAASTRAAAMAQSAIHVRGSRRSDRAGVEAALDTTVARPTLAKAVEIGRAHV